MNINDFKRHLNCFRRKRQREVVKNERKIRWKKRSIKTEICWTDGTTLFLEYLNFLKLKITVKI